MCRCFRGELRFCPFFQDDLCIKQEQVLAWRRWVDLRHRVPGASARLFCCPWAGGNSLAFERWPEQLPGVEVVPLLLPGRLTRAGESSIRNLPELVQLAVEALRGLNLLAHEDIPYFMLGHEFGALVAFEMCRSVQQAEIPIQGLFVSSMSCPQVCVCVCVFINRGHLSRLLTWADNLPNHHQAVVVCAWFCVCIDSEREIIRIYLLL